MTGDGFEARGSGAVDMEGLRGALTLRYEPSEARSARASSIEDLTTEIVYDRGFAYVRSPRFLTDVLVAKSWLQIPVDEEQRDGLVDLLAGFSPSPLHDPAGMLDFLRAASGRVEEVGSEEVREARTNRYRATVDLEQVVALVTGDRREALRWEIDWRREEDLPTTLQVEVWIDDDGLARRVRTWENHGAGVFTIEYFDYGAELEIALPPADEVTTLEAVWERVARQPADASCDDEVEFDEDRSTVTESSSFWLDGTSESGATVSVYCVEDAAPGDPNGE